MHLLSYLNTYGLKGLDKAPYNLTIKQDEDFYLFKYNQYASDMSLTEVQEARGSIFINENGKWKYVCRPFDKFFNYGEEYAASIDWNSAYITQKIDGNLMKVWYYNGWHLSTNGTINAFSTYVNGTNITFGDIFVRNLGTDFNDWADISCAKGFTTMLELTSPETQVVIPYDNGIYYLTSRSNNSGNYYHFAPNNVKFPKIYRLFSLKDTLDVVNQMSNDEEGVVVADLFGKRIKIKSLAYLTQAHIISAGPLTVKKVIKMFQNDMLDDCLAYYPNSRNDIQKIMSLYEEIKTDVLADWNSVKKYSYLQRYEFFLKVKKMQHVKFIMNKYTNNDSDVNLYVEFLPRKKIVELIEAKLNNKGEKHERP